MKTKKMFISFTIVGVLSIAAVGCSEDDTESTELPASTSDAETESTETTEETKMSFEERVTILEDAMGKEGSGKSLVDVTMIGYDAIPSEGGYTFLASDQDEEDLSMVKVVLNEDETVIEDVTYTELKE
ncbi:hypothetical protein [Halobacillus andaensis]|uniref:hypothetical protein n=1 Tax=Halobacillus andaensis TaxID=1176239 RepID=UPI003D758483